VAYKANPDQVYLMGFSQGASMALCVMASEPDKVAGAVVVNGQLLPETRALITKPSALRGFPVLVVHGLSDDFAPIAQGHAIHEMLTGWAANIIYREYPMGHLLTQESLIDTRSWLKSRLDEKGIIADSEAPAYQARLGHVHLKVRNLDRAVGFYIRVLGFHLVERVGNAYAFLSGGNAHHEIALQNVGLNAPVPPPQATGLYHVAFEVPDQESFARAYKALKKADIQVTTVDQVISWGMYFTDPDGNGIEIYCDARNLPGRSDLWRGRDSPLELSKILAVLENLD
jgi:catechol 2,3-dioxygenase